MAKLTLSEYCDISNRTITFEKDAGDGVDFTAGDFFEAVLEFYLSLGFATDVEISIGDGNLIPKDIITYDKENYITREGGYKAILDQLENE